MTEIGGYFGLEELGRKEYYAQLISLNTARNCLLYLLRAKNIKKIYMPYFLCDSVINICNKYRIKYEFYHVNANFMPIFDRNLFDNECIYIVNYYGQMTNEKIAFFKKKYEYIILDNTQAFFQRPIREVDTIYSCRKFFGVPDGAYLSTNIKLNEKIETDISSRRMKHILGRYEESATKYYSDFKEVDEAFEYVPLKYMSKLTHNILGAIDYERVCRIRTENYTYLVEQLSSKNKLNLVEQKGAFAYPFYTTSEAIIKRKLLEKKVYIPTLWPNVLDGLPKNSVEYKYTMNILPLPCDQRYTVKDMKYIVQEMEKI